MAALRKNWAGSCLAVFTIIAGSFVCVAGTFVSIKVSGAMTTAIPTAIVTNCCRLLYLQLIVEAYKDGLVGKPFTC